MGLKIGSQVIYKGEDEISKGYGVMQVTNIVKDKAIVVYKANKKNYAFKFNIHDLQEITPKTAPITKEEFDREFFRTSEEITQELIKDLKPSEVLNHMTFVGLFMDKFSKNLFTQEVEDEG